MPGAEPVSRRQHDFPVHGLNRPAACDELYRQVVEQPGMRRPLAKLAEVAGSGHEPPAEMLLPDAVDHHSRREGVFGRRDGLGQRQPPAAVAEFLPRLFAEHLQESRRRHLAQVLGIAPDCYAYLFDFFFLAIAVDERVSRRNRFLERLQFRFESREMRKPGAAQKPLDVLGTVVEQASLERIAVFPKRLRTDIPPQIPLHRIDEFQVGSEPDFLAAGALASAELDVVAVVDGAFLAMDSEQLAGELSGQPFGAGFLRTVLVGFVPSIEVAVFAVGLIKVIGPSLERLLVEAAFFRNGLNIGAVSRLPGGDEIVLRFSDQDIN